MLELVAQGVEPNSRWRRQLPVDTEIVLGRETRPWSVEWDLNISRHHFNLVSDGESVRVSKLESAANPVFFQGVSADSFTLQPGQHFVVGKTTFTLLSNRAFVTQDVPDPIRQKTFTNEYLRQLPYRDANQRMEVLNRLPKLISSAANVDGLVQQVASMLLAGIPSATTVGVVASDSSGTRLIDWDYRGSDSIEFQPSERLIRTSVESNQSILHVWSGEGKNAEFTLDYDNDWAFVVPFSGAATPGWGIYVAGRNSMGQGSGHSRQVDADLQDDIKFTELVTSTIANVLLVKSLERQQTSLRPFFAPVVLQAIGEEDPERVLAPRECDVAVLFCDLKGFSKTSEEMAGDLIGLLDRVSQKLGIMTRNILSFGGVVGDFHGDAAMGFWGWPLEQEDSAKSACLASLSIQDELELISSKNPDLTSRDLEIGMGIATGRAVVGKIGTKDQVKVTAFGPVVNLASRLEGLTRKFGGLILVDQCTAHELDRWPESGLSSRRLAKVQPFGLRSSYDIFELRKTVLSSEHSNNYTAALDAFESGDWPLAKTIFERCPDDDPARNFLLEFIRDRRSPPEHWSGVLTDLSK